MHFEQAEIDQGYKKQVCIASITILESVAAVEGVESIVVDTFQQTLEDCL